MAVPGAGLLALLRKRSDPEGLGAAVTPPATATAAAGPSMFEARSSAVHALEHAVAAGTMGEAARPAAQGRRIPPGPRYVYDVDVHEPHEAQPQLPVRALLLAAAQTPRHAAAKAGAGAACLCGGRRAPAAAALAAGPLRAPCRGAAAVLAPLTLPCPLRAHTQVTPVTLINTDYALHHYRQNAVSSAYICYGLKQVRQGC